MRTHGTLTKWNDDRGFGFIEPAGGAEELFVHVSTFPHDGIRPRIGELVSFDVELQRDGKKRAVRVMRPGTRAASHRTRRPSAKSTRHGPLAAVAGLLLLLAAIGWYGYSRITANHAFDSTPIPAPTSRVSQIPAPTPHPIPATLAPPPRETATLTPPVSHATPAIVEAPTQLFHCDGRTRCPQMTSCAEATFFIKQCPGTKMDGDGDGVPCEGQWCG